MHDVAWRGMWICVRSKDAQKQVARTSLKQYSGNFPGGGGIWTAFLVQWEGNLNKNFLKMQMPWGLPGGMLKLRFD